jgi:deoxycytidylate deaminase
MIRVARDLAVAAHRDKDCYYQLCALVVRKNRVIGVGYNNPKTHPRALTKMKQQHAELAAILAAPSLDLSGCELIVVRARRDHKMGMAKPCLACQRIIHAARIKKVYYTLTCDKWDTPEVETMDL